MPRNGSGTSSVVNTFVIDTVADPDEVNANFTDVADQLTNSLPRDGQAGMNAPLPLQNGTAPLPALTFTSDPNTGIFRKAADTVGITGNGIEIAAFSPTGLTITGEFSSTVISGLGVQGHIFGLNTSNNVADATNDIDIAVGSAASDGTTPYLMTLASALTKRLDAAWAVGTNAGGLDTGSIANTGYHIWLIQRSDTGVVDALFSTSATAPTMPTNYDRKRRIAWIQRAAATITPYRQSGPRFMLTTQQTQYTNSGVINLTQLIGTVGPSGIRYRPILQSTTVMAGASTGIIALGDGDGAAVQANIQWVTGQANDIAVEDEFVTNTNTQVRHSITTTAGTFTSYTLNSIGWWDDRGVLG